MQREPCPSVSTPFRLCLAVFFCGPQQPVISTRRVGLQGLASAGLRQSFVLRMPVDVRGTNAQCLTPSSDSLPESCSDSISDQHLETYPSCTVDHASSVAFLVPSLRQRSPAARRSSSQGCTTALAVLLTAFRGILVQRSTEISMPAHRVNTNVFAELAPSQQQAHKSGSCKEQLGSLCGLVGLL